jgi:hypothetical protein
MASLGIPVPAYASVASQTDIYLASPNRLARDPKTRRFGYDGVPGPIRPATTLSPRGGRSARRRRS